MIDQFKVPKPVDEPVVETPVEDTSMSRRTAAGGLASLLALAGFGSSADARRGAEPKAKSAPAPAPKAAPRPENIEIPGEPEKIAEIRDYMRRLGSAPEFVNGSPADMAKLWLGAREGGLRPEVPAREDSLGRTWYPRLDARSWPTIDLAVNSQRPGTDGKIPEGAQVSVTAIRIGPDRIQTTDTAMGAVFGQNAIRNQLPINIRGISLKLPPSVSSAPILSPIPEVNEAEIKDGTYVVGLGKSALVNDNGLNTTNFGGFHLPGFLVRIKDKPALRKLFEDNVRSAPGTTETDVAQMLAVLDNSFLMIPNDEEWKDFHDRGKKGHSGIGQPVYVSTDQRGFRRAGMIHAAGLIGATVDGNKKDLPFFLVHGSESYRKIDAK